MNLMLYYLENPKSARRLAVYKPGLERPESHDLAGAILFVLQDPVHFKKLKWRQSWHKLVRL